MFCTVRISSHWWLWSKYHKPCRGDSGGPCACKNKGSFELSGIVSFGISDKKPFNCKEKPVAFYADVLGKGREGLGSGLKPGGHLNIYFL